MIGERWCEYLPFGNLTDEVALLGIKSYYNGNAIFILALKISELYIQAEPNATVTFTVRFPCEK